MKLNVHIRFADGFNIEEKYETFEQAEAVAEQICQLMFNLAEEAAK